MSSRGSSLIILLVSLLLTRTFSFQFSQRCAGARKNLSIATPPHRNLKYNGGAAAGSQLALHVGLPYSSFGGGMPSSLNQGHGGKGDAYANMPYAPKTSSPSTTTGSSTMAVMISHENKRILIEELGYKRADVQRLKFDLALSLVAKRIKCPNGGLPDSWCVVGEPSSSSQPQESFGEEEKNKYTRMMMRRPLLEPENNPPARQTVSRRWSSNEPENKPPARQTVSRRWSSTNAKGRPGLNDSGSFFVM